METNNVEIDGPKYKVSSFLFGNVDKQGRIEDYQNDEDLKTIDNLDQCHVREVEDTARQVMAEDAQLIESGPSLSVSTDPSDPPISTDYYDEHETISDGTALPVLLLSDLPMDVALPLKTNDENYDSPEHEDSRPAESQLTTTDLTTLLADDNEKQNLPHTDAFANSKSSLTREHFKASYYQPSMSAEVLVSVSEKTIEDERVKPEQAVGPVRENTPASSLAASDSTEHPLENDVLLENGSLLMPPPSCPAGFATQQQCATAPTHQLDQLIGVGIPNVCTATVDSCPVPAAAAQPSQEPPLLNTPLGSLMPAEYVGVDIAKLFPNYDPRKPPRWSSIFRLAHSPDTYRECIGNAASTNELLAEKLTAASDKPHLMLDGYLDLGELPFSLEDVEENRPSAAFGDELDELSRPPPPGTDYLAGSEQSWWRRAYSLAMAALRPEDEEEEKELAVASRSAGREEARMELPNGRQKQQPLCDSSVEDKRFCGDASGTGKAETVGSRADVFCCTFRLGPAKYWYDQLGIPMDADIFKWNRWRLRVNPVTASEDKVEDEELKLSGATEIAGARTAHRDASVRSGPATKPEESDVDRPDDLPASAEPCDTPLSSQPKSVVCDLPSNCFYPYQLINWEEDIIYDPQLSSSKISANFKAHAAYAGWIPLPNYRTMAAFQDAYCDKFPLVVNSRALNHLTSGSTVMEKLLALSDTSQVFPAGDAAADPDPPYSIFPVDNQGILSDAWVEDIIYDADTYLPPPFLLTLDMNDESCILDSPTDETIAMAISAARDARQRMSMTSASAGQSAETGSNSSAVVPASARFESEEAAAHHHQQLGGGAGAGSSDKAGSSTLNRASLQVSFGMASTRGMLTGALAKAEHGAEKVKMILGKHGLLAEDDWQADQNTTGLPPSASSTAATKEASRSEGSAALASAAAAAGLPPKDPLNLSNDEFYAVRSGALAAGGGLARCGPLQHSTPAVELWPPFFPTHMGPLRLRQFHRVSLRRHVRSWPLQYNTPISVTNLTRNIQRKLREREEEKAATGGGEIFFMRTPPDLTGADGDLVLFEHSEEYPPFLSQVGMATRIINYYRPLNPRDRSLSPAPNATQEPPDLPYGSLVYVSGTDSPFLGVIRPGGHLQTLENNMYRAPVYPHSMPQTDFLVIRNRNGLSIRRVNTVFCTGQEIPLMEVPGPNSKRANNFVRDFLQVFILRLFLRSMDEPKRIKMEEIRSAYLNHSESSIRKRLKICADFKRTGNDASWWVLRSDYRLPSEEEVRYLVTPEDYCAHYSMLAAELRLKDAGYGEKSLFVLDENQEGGGGEADEEEEGQPKMEDEVRAAPWNTTRAYLAAQRGGCFLELHGSADPTGCGEAFSYSKASTKPGALFRQSGGEVARGLLKGGKRTVTGTDADLRKLHLRDARSLLRSFGISEADLKTFKRWEIIDMVRFASTERAKQGEEESSAKFARGNRLSMTEQVRCYREECQRIFDLQNRVLSNPELLSSDEEVSSEEDEDEVTAAATTAAGQGSGVASGGAASSSGMASSAAPHGPVNSIGGIKLSSLSARSFTASASSRAAADEEMSRQSRRLYLPPGSDLVSGSRTGTTSAAATADQTGPDGLSPSAIYEASSTSAGIILDLPPPWPSASRKMLRIIRKYPTATTGGASGESGEPMTTTTVDKQPALRAELVPWSPVVEIYLKIRQTRDDEFIHSFVDSDDKVKEQQRKEKRRIQDQLRRLKKQQALMRERTGLASTSAGLRGSASAGGASTASSLINADRQRHRRRHKPLTAAHLKMRCGACGQTGHMRTNKECPMYGQSDSVTAAASSDQQQQQQQSVTAAARGRGSRGSANRQPAEEALAAAQALASRPVSELLAEEEAADQLDKSTSGQQQRGGDHVIGGDRQTGESADRLSHTEDVMTMEGTKLKMHANLTRFIHEQNRRNLTLKIRRRLLDRLNAAVAVVQSANSSRRLSAAGGRTGAAVYAGATGRRRSTAAAPDDDVFPTNLKHRGNRRRIDPRVALNHIFEGIYKDLTQIPGSKIFMHPVKERDFPNYYSEIDTPMDLSQIRMKINENAYATREEFLADIRLIHDNSLKFNGRYSSYTETAMKMCSMVLEEFCHKEVKLMRLESLVNPLLDENDLVVLNYLLQQAIEAMRAVEHSRPFHTPVERRRYPDYYRVISNPMDLSTLEKMVKDNRFHSRAEFIVQVELILSNCIAFNGQQSPLTEIARKMLEAGKARLEQDSEALEAVELNIRSQLGTTTMTTALQDLTGTSTSGAKAEKQGGSSGCGVRPTLPVAPTAPSTSGDMHASQPPASPRARKRDRSLHGKTGRDPLTALDSPSGGSDCELESERPNKRHRPAATVAGGVARAEDGEDARPGQTADRTSSCSGRTLRHRASDAVWYGVDLEYDDDDDDDDDDDEDDDGKVAAAKQSTRQLSSSQPVWTSDDEVVGGAGSSKPRQSSVILTDADYVDDDDDGAFPGGELEDNGAPFAGGDIFSADTTLRSMQEMQVNDEEEDTAQSYSDVRYHRKAGADGDEDADDDDVEGDAEEFGEDRSDDDISSLTGRDAPVCSFDEDTQFSMAPSGGGDYTAEDDLVAQDLQLTDSEEGSSLSGQGGELCADDGDNGEFTASHSQQTRFMAAGGYSEATGDSGSKLGGGAVQSDRVAFFIGEEELEEEYEDEDD